MDAAAGVVAPRPTQHGADDLLGRLPVELQRHAGRVEARQLQRVVGQAAELRALVDDGLRQALALVAAEPVALLGSEDAAPMIVASGVR